MANKKVVLADTMTIERCPVCGSKNVKRNGVDTRHKLLKHRCACKVCGKNFYEGSKDNTTKRVIVLGDMHCGHHYGLTPPQNWVNEKSLPHVYAFQKESWEWFIEATRQLGPFDICICNGDAIDGRQGKNGGRELLENSCLKQVEMATFVLKQVEARRYLIVKGTPYHTGQEEDYESQLARNMKSEIYNKLFLDVNGVKIKARHKVNRSIVPYGRATPLLRSLMWDTLTTMAKDQEANIMIFNHVHYYLYAGYENKLVLTAPGLQGNSEFGETQCEGSTDYGFLVFDIQENGEFTHKAVLGHFDSTKAQPVY